MITSPQLLRDLQDIAAGRMKKIKPGKLAEYERDGYITIDEYDSITFTTKGAHIRNGKATA